MSLIHIFAVNLKKYRTAQNLSQEYLAELAGLHRTYISALEREQRNISIENIQRIANALKIEPYRLLIENSDKND
jgi:transcriptional regulator with XRE-family HTH domain